MLFEDFLLSKDIIKFIFEKSLKFLQDIPFFGMTDLKIYFFIFSMILEQRLFEGVPKVPNGHFSVDKLNENAILVTILAGYLVSCGESKIQWLLQG